MSSAEEKMSISERSSLKNTSSNKTNVPNLTGLSEEYILSTVQVKDEAQTRNYHGRKPSESVRVEQEFHLQLITEDSRSCSRQELKKLKREKEFHGGCYALGSTEKLLKEFTNDATIRKVLFSLEDDRKQVQAACPGQEQQSPVQVQAACPGQEQQSPVQNTDVLQHSEPDVQEVKDIMSAQNETAPLLAIEAREHKDTTSASYGTNQTEEPIETEEPIRTEEPIQSEEPTLLEESQKDAESELLLKPELPTPDETPVPGASDLALPNAPNSLCCTLV